MFLIDKEYYYLDLEAIRNSVFKGGDDKFVNVIERETIRDTNDNVLQTTEISKVNNEVYHMRYDMIKAMLDHLYSSGVESEDGNVKYIQDLDSSSLGTKLIFNTLIENGFLKNKLD